MISEKVKASIASDILKRTEYGRRTEVAACESMVAAWSNASAQWFVFWGVAPVPKGHSISLDANQILIPKKSAEEVEEWFDSREAPQLPLYAFSIEAMERARRR